MRRVLVVGFGLIGGSAGQALRRRGWHVTFLDPHVTLGQAQVFKNADERVEQIADANADIILLATPVDVAVNILRTLETEAVVTSACSVMRALRDVARGTFVAGHPMAGSERRGIAAAEGHLFENKRWFVDAQHPLVEDLIRDCGAIPDRIGAAEHDAAVALTSHLPQVLSTALAAHLDGHPEVLRFAGEGLRTFLRLAGSDASIWMPILAENRDELAPHVEGVAKLAEEIATGDATDAFERAQRFWRKL